MKTSTNLLLKGLTRPPMFLGVPTIILFPVGLIILMIFVLLGNTLILFMSVPLWAVLKFYAKKDPYIFNFLLLNLKELSIS